MMKMYAMVQELASDCTFLSYHISLGVCTYDGFLCRRSLHCENPNNGMVMPHALHAQSV